MAGIEAEQVRSVVSTGYGRKSVPFATGTLTEISCHARGCLHFFPGRVRFKIRQVQQSPEFGERIRNELLAVPGIRAVEVHPKSGSVIVSYQAGRIRSEMDALCGVLSRLFPEPDSQRLRSWLGR